MSSDPAILAAFAGKTGNELRYFDLVEIKFLNKRRKVRARGADATLGRTP